MRLVVGLRALESGEKGMVDVDHASTEFGADPVRQNLHVAGQHDHISIALSHDGQESLLLLALVL